MRRSGKLTAPADAKSSLARTYNFHMAATRLRSVNACLGVGVRVSSISALDEATRLAFITVLQQVVGNLNGSFGAHGFTSPVYLQYNDLGPFQKADRSGRCPNRYVSALFGSKALLPGL